jgi:hypothetical protein
LDQLVKAREGAIFHIVEQVDVHPFRPEEFIHFNLFISPREKKIPESYAFYSVPTGPPIVRGFENAGLIAYRSHDVMLPSFNRFIRLHVSRHTGILANDVIAEMCSY